MILRPLSIKLLNCILSLVKETIDVLNYLTYTVGNHRQFLQEIEVGMGNESQFINKIINTRIEFEMHGDEQECTVNN